MLSNEEITEVLKHANTFASKYTRYHEVNFEDLLDIYLNAIVKGLEQFENKEGFSFKTYVWNRACWDLKEYFKIRTRRENLTEIKKEEYVYLPEYLIVMIKDRRLRELAYLCIQEYTGREIAEELGISPSRVSQLLRDLRKVLNKRPKDFT